MTTIFLSKGLQFITDVHLVVDGLTPSIIFGCPIQFDEKGKLFNTNNCICIVGHQQDGTHDNLHRMLDNFKDISKKAEDSFQAVRGEEGEDSEAREEGEDADSKPVSFSMPYAHFN